MAGSKSKRAKNSTFDGRKLKNSKEGPLEDRISDSPDSILGHIFIISSHKRCRGNSDFIKKMGTSLA